MSQSIAIFEIWENALNTQLRKFAFAIVVEQEHRCYKINWKLGLNIPCVYLAIWYMNKETNKRAFLDRLHFIFVYLIPNTLKTYLSRFIIAQTFVVHSALLRYENLRPNNTKDKQTHLKNITHSSLLLLHKRSIH